MERPHRINDQVKDWETRADDILATDGLGVDATTLQALVWDGLQESIKGGWRTAAEAEETYFEWFKHKHGEL